MRFGRVLKELERCSPDMFIDIGGKPNFYYICSIENGVITMASKEKPSETITSTTVDGVTTIVYAASLGGNQVNLTFTCSDISALESAE